MPDETTNPGTPIPPASSAVASTQATGMTINLNPRNLMLSALLFLGGMGGGGGVSTFIGGDVKEEISEVKDSVDDMKAELVEIRSDLKADRRGEEQIMETLGDHEDRIRKLEQETR